MIDIESWIQENLLDAVVDDNIVTVKDVGNFLIIKEKYFVTEGDRTFEVVKSYFEKFDDHSKFIRLFDDGFRLLLDQEEADAVVNESLDIKYFLFNFGNKWYYCDDWENPVLNEFKYLGKAKIEESSFPFLGVHGAYDLCNGSRLYSDWCKKSNFLGIDTLGIAEQNTLAGTLDFQSACKDAGIKSIIGETISVKSKFNYTVKLYVKNIVGWKNLLRINSEINVFNNGFIAEHKLLGLGEGLICVISPEALEHFPYQEYSNCFEGLFFQFDLLEWDSNEKDKKWCGIIKNYLDNWYDKIPHIFISDAYYLDKSDSGIRKILNKIGHGNFQFSSKNQWFKASDEIAAEIAELFNENDSNKFFDILERGCTTLINLCKEIDFKIEIGKLKLPKYKMTKEEAIKYHGNSYDMIVDLIGEGFHNKIAGKVADEDLYWKRVEMELEVINKGNVVDYFLILWDIINWCNKQDIWVGIGRGSAAGCLISYLLGIVKIDPIKYDLIFERFLNEGRVGKSLPDIDTDFEGERRDEVKRYIEEKYGIDYVTSIGTYSTMKAKAAINDLARYGSVAISETRLVTKAIDPESTFTEIFKHASEAPLLKNYIIKHPNVIENIPLCMNQPKTASVHAAGVVIVPEEYGIIYEQMPIKKMDGLLVSEWEGEFIDKAGFLKCDILGIKQLDKFSAISKLIEANKGIKITFDDIDKDLDNPAVFKLFQEGNNEDVFQFGTPGLKAYCKKLKPDKIEDLIAAVALYRPGAMDTGGHERYVNVKQGLEEPVYWYGCENITKNTYGILVYQEQVMRVVQEIGGFTLVEADDIRKAMGKKDRVLLDSNKEKFIDGAILNGCPPDEADGLWQAMETFAGYAFNRSHAACYAIMGYYSQWFKVNYPLEFWTIALQFADDKEMLGRIAEVNQISKIEVAPPHINKSKKEFTPDQKTNSIYWSINSISNVGAVSINDITKEKDENGMFFSFEEFLERVEKYRAINKRTIKHLILSGAFDEIEKINPSERYLLLRKFYNSRKIEFDEDILGCEKWEDYKWTMMQRQISKSGYIDFKKIVESSAFAYKADRYYEIQDLLNAVDDGSGYVAAGIVNKIVERDSRNGKWGNIELQDNTGTVNITVWNEIYLPYKERLKNAMGHIMIFVGRIGIDKFKNRNTLYSNNSTKLEIL